MEALLQSLAGESSSCMTTSLLQLLQQNHQRRQQEQQREQQTRQQTNLDGQQNPLLQQLAQAVQGEAMQRQPSTQAASAPDGSSTEQQQAAMASLVRNLNANPSLAAPLLQILEEAQDAQRQADRDARRRQDALGPRQIPNPPESIEYPTMSALLDGLNAFYRDHGAAVVKKSASNYRVFNGKKQPSYYSVHCDRGPKRPSSSKGARRASSTKLDCPFRIVAAATAKHNFSWKYRVVVAEHNHGPSEGPAAHAMHRRRTPAQKELMAKLSHYDALKARDAAEIVRTAAGGSAFFTAKDVYNDRQRARKDAGISKNRKQQQRRRVEEEQQQQQQQQHRHEGQQQPTARQQEQQEQQPQREQQED
ncbi:hypothetical protein DCS_03418 [Drechmeria coniospora]|uniref:FAR1 domain-containing protein n=1 Tax=Drechmeria coniospora TaxID=98403 RepID=A0A151GH38_DRECN|nr:hypothetical protein DCS_03418 [Drechmeria coniospora]KYK56418.1 hypothetical protein DCS_03418 [Drechmeria coniospora]ODA76868.1 hypothetical protein RJ55_07384 [Drechmeria coniospora]